MPSHVFQKHLDGQKKATNRMNSSPNRNQQPTNGWHSNDTLERTQDKWQTFYQNIDDCSNFRQVFSHASGNSDIFRCEASFSPRMLASWTLGRKGDDDDDDHDAR